MSAAGGDAIGLQRIPDVVRCRVTLSADLDTRFTVNGHRPQRVLDSLPEVDGYTLAARVVAGATHPPSPVADFRLPVTLARCTEFTMAVQIFTFRPQRRSNKCESSVSSHAQEIDLSSICQGMLHADSFCETNYCRFPTCAPHREWKCQNREPEPGLDVGYGPTRSAVVSIVRHTPGRHISKRSAGERVIAVFSIRVERRQKCFVLAG